ncbi:hypothetical protein [Flavobacterium sp. CS20]|uniref:hypothetical protein n=1 Tax=Flavobacterium sp. CS20 TaxID=2775246 RepID=UPI001B39FBB3|nr:hypothetical protein [Flavobacterium sp. CS20]QTY27843.1 hypothetical protein IGB25_04830 [Flavobacterium sp. CS20]
MGKNYKTRPNFRLFDIFIEEKTFIIIVIVGFILAGASTAYNWQIAMWIGFMFVAYAAVANDSIQTIGTFIESNSDKKWWYLWLFIGIIFLATVCFSFFYYDGDVSYQRLQVTNEDGGLMFPHPKEFSFFQIIAPLVLLILTRLRMPVSTTFLLLSVFSASSSGITSIVYKSWTGYILAFILSFLIWNLAYDFIRKRFKSRQYNKAWTYVQWAVSGSLWSVWIMQDGANIAVFLPRQLEFYQFIIFSATIFIGLGLLFYFRGDKIQQIVSEKARISDVRAATLVDFSYVILLIYKLFISNIPMSTTWIFLGIIGGREIAISFARKKKGNKHKKKAFNLVLKDFGSAMAGLLISVALLAGVNSSIRDDISNLFEGLF